MKVRHLPPYDSVEPSSESILASATLPVIGMASKSSGLSDLKAETTSKNAIYSDGDCLTTVVSLFCHGVPHYTFINNWQPESKTVAHALGLKHGLPSEETTRQRLGQIGTDETMLDKIIDSSMRLLKLRNYTPPTVKIGDDEYIRVDVDSSVFVNDDCQKEGIGLGYNMEIGFQPRLAFAADGVIFNGELAPGNHNPLHVGYQKFFVETRERVRSLVEDPDNIKILWVSDCGFIQAI
jgi:hypothetical protein